MQQFLNKMKYEGRKRKGTMRRRRRRGRIKININIRMKGYVRTSSYASDTRSHISQTVL
jgi:hypothetical protein